MTPNHLASDGGTHLRGRFRFAFGPKTAGDVVQIGFGKTPGAQQNTIAAFYASELYVRLRGTEGPQRAPLPVGAAIIFGAAWNRLSGSAPASITSSRNAMCISEVV